MRILIVEPHASGHRASYLRWLVLAAVQKQWSVVVATTAATLSHPLLARIRYDFRGVEIHVMEDIGSADHPAVGTVELILREIAYWKAFKRTAASVRRNQPVDAALVPYIDYCFYALAVLGSPFAGLPWCAISMRLSVDTAVTALAEGGERAKGSGSGLPLKWRLARRMLEDSKLRSLFVINPSVQDIPSDWYSAALRSKLHYLADPAECSIEGKKPASRRALGVSEGDVAILVYGTIDERKGLDGLLNGLSAAGGHEFVIILAGKQSASVKHLLESQDVREKVSSRRIIVMDGLLTEAEQDLALAAADIVWLGYRNHVHMSGVLVLAGKAGLPVLGTHLGEIGRLIAKYRIGIAVATDEPADVARALQVMLDAPARAQMGQRAQAVFESHTVENFGATVMSAFDSQASC